MVTYQSLEIWRNFHARYFLLAGLLNKEFSSHIITMCDKLNMLELTLSIASDNKSLVVWNDIYDLTNLIEWSYKAKCGWVSLFKTIILISEIVVFILNGWIHLANFTFSILNFFLKCDSFASETPNSDGISFWVVEYEIGINSKSCLVDRWL